jgi:replicative DNA helicase
VRLVVIDYLQIYAQVADDPEKSISYMARTAKNIAKELGIAIILISQLNRSALHPSLNMLRGSGQIEESADNVVLIDRPDAYPDNKVTKYEGQFSDSPVKGTAKLILAKGRGVGTGSQLVKFKGEYTQFSEIPKPDDTGHYEEQDEELPF